MLWARPQRRKRPSPAGVTSAPQASRNAVRRGSPRDAAMISGLHPASPGGRALGSAPSTKISRSAHADRLDSRTPRPRQHSMRSVALYTGDARSMRGWSGPHRPNAPRSFCTPRSFES